MDARPKTRQVNRERRTPPPQATARGQTDCHSHDPPAVRRNLAGCPAPAAFVDEWAQLALELFPEDFDQGYCLHGFGHESRKLPGLKLRTFPSSGDRLQTSIGPKRASGR